MMALESTWMLNGATTLYCRFRIIIVNVTYVKLRLALTSYSSVMVTGCCARPLLMSLELRRPGARTSHFSNRWPQLRPEHC